MFRRRTVLVVGAGASFELGFPTGAELLQKVASALDIRFRYHERVSGSGPVLEAYRRHHRVNCPESDLNDYLHAGWRLREAATVARSIDNAIDQNCDDPKVETAGKFAIALEILNAERRSKLFVDHTTAGASPIEQAQGTWLIPFTQMLTTDLRRNQAERIFETLKIVTFNYDRSIEHFLPFALHAAYGIPMNEGKALVYSLDIHHAYGQVGTLPWLNSEGASAVEFGQNPGQRLESLAAGIQTFSESREPDSDLHQMHEALAWAEQIVFLGFGFHRPNMDLLAPAGGISASLATGTVYEEPQPAREVAEQLVRSWYKNVSPPAPILVDATCATYLAEHYSVLTK